MAEDRSGPNFLLPETFHRTKRTLLIFAAALIVVAYSTTGDNNAIEISPIKGDLPAVIARLLLTVGLAYYLIGFLFEFGSARRIHGETANSTAIADHEQKFAAMTNDIETLTRQVRQAGESYLGALEVGVAAIELRVRGPEKLENEDFDRIVLSRSEGDNIMLQRATAEQREDYYERIRVEVRKKLEALAEHESEQFVTAPKRVEEAIAQAGVEQHALVDALTGISKDLDGQYARITRLNRHIGRERWWAFFGWEVGGVVASSVFAILVAWTDFGVWSSEALQQVFYLPGV